MPVLHMALHGQRGGWATTRMRLSPSRAIIALAAALLCTQATASDNGIIAASSAVHPAAGEHALDVFVTGVTLHEATPVDKPGRPLDVDGLAYVRCHPMTAAASDQQFGSNAAEVSHLHLYEAVAVISMRACVRILTRFIAQGPACSAARLCS